MCVLPSPPTWPDKGSFPPSARSFGQSSAAIARAQLAAAEIQSCSRPFPFERCPVDGTADRCSCLSNADAVLRAAPPYFRPITAAVPDSYSVFASCSALLNMRTARGSNQPEDKRFRVQFSKKTDVSDPFLKVKIGNVLDTAPHMFKGLVDNYAGTSPFHPMFLKLRTDLVTKAMTRTVPRLDLPGSCTGRQAHSFRAGFPLMHHDEQSYIDKYIAQARKTLTTEGDGEDSEEEQTPAGGGGAQAGAGSQDQGTGTPWGPVERLLPDLDACADATTSWIHLCCCGAALTSNIVDRMKELTAELARSLIEDPDALSLQKLRQVEYQVRETYDFSLQIAQMQTTTRKRNDVSRQVPVPQVPPPHSGTGSMAGSGATDESGTGADNVDASAAPNCVATIVPEEGGDSVNAAETGEDVPKTGGTQLQQSDPGHEEVLA